MIKFTSLLVLTVALSSASTITWVTPDGSSVAGGTVNASATVVTDFNNVTVTLSNLQANPTNVGQLISGFAFTLSSTPTTALNSTSTPTNTALIYINDTGTDVIAPWLLTSTGATILLERLGALGSPSQLIIGPAPYDKAKGSIDGNAPHNPFLDRTATFSFHVEGVSATTSVTGVTFNFGTDLDAANVRVSGECFDCGAVTTSGGEVPEPFSVFLIGGGLLGVGIFGKLRRA